MISDPAAPTRPTPAEPIGAEVDLVDAARDLVPLLRAQAGESEDLGRLTDASAAALRDGGFLSLFAPRRFGGHECDLRTATAVFTELGRGCGSSAWVAALLSGASYLASLLGEQACQEIWGTDPHAAVCGGFSTPGTAERVPGGLAVSGRWQPLSGVYQAQWALLGVPLVDVHGATVGRGMALVPISGADVEQTWHVAGMQGTGSHTLAVDGAVVPDHRVLPFSRVLVGADAGEFPRGSIYTAAPFSSLSVAMLGALLGMADAALDLATEYVAGRAISGTIYVRAVDSPSVRLGVADAARLVGTAHLHADRAIADLEHSVSVGVRPDRAARARIRMDIGAAARATTAAARLLLDACGSSSFALGRPLQRIWRNLEVASRHPALAFDLGREIYANALLGVDEEITPLY